MVSLLALLTLAGTAAPPSPGPVTIPFQTDAAIRIDPVFGDAGTLRVALDRFAALQGQMDHVRDDFSAAVHETLATLQPTASTAAAPPGKSCPPESAAPYARALSWGARYLTLGRQLQARYREIRRGDDAGDTLGLTPDYRWKVRKAKTEFAHVLGDYREMRVAFYDQLGAELRHAGCKPGHIVARATPGGAASPTDPAAPAAPNPSDPTAWVLDDRDDEGPAVPRAISGALGPRLPAEATTAAPAPPAASAAPAIWIEIDNALCAQTTHVTIDGQSMGELPARAKTSVRTRAGPRELCVLPSNDRRTCGDPGTLRKAYLHEGWSLTVHCTR